MLFSLFRLGRVSPTFGLIISCLVLAIGPGAAAQSATPAENALARNVVGDPRFRAAVGAFDRDFERFVNELIQLTEIPAPPFGEGPRAQAYLAMLKDAGLEANAAKAEIDRLAAARDARAQHAAARVAAGGSTAAVDDEAYQLLQQLKAAKARCGGMRLMYTMPRFS